MQDYVKYSIFNSFNPYIKKYKYINRKLIKEIYFEHYF